MWKSPGNVKLNELHAGFLVNIVSRLSYISITNIFQPFLCSRQAYVVQLMGYIQIISNSKFPYFASYCWGNSLPPQITCLSRWFPVNFKNYNILCFCVNFFHNLKWLRNSDELLIFKYWKWAWNWFLAVFYT